jgi:hypothetical protein
MGDEDEGRAESGLRERGCGGGGGGGVQCVVL